MELTQHRLTETVVGSSSDEMQSGSNYSNYTGTMAPLQANQNCKMAAHNNNIASDLVRQKRVDQLYQENLQFMEYINQLQAYINWQSSELQRLKSAKLHQDATGISLDALREDLNILKVMFNPVVQKMKQDTESERLGVEVFVKSLTGLFKSLDRTLITWEKQQTDLKQEFARTKQTLERFANV